MKKESKDTNPLRRIREMLGFLTQREFAVALKVKPQHLSRAENRSRLSLQFERKILAYARGSRSAEDYAKVVAALQARVSFGKDVLKQEEIVKTGWEPAQLLPVEREAWSWALTFRNSALLEAAAAQAIRSGTSCTRIRHGVIFGSGAAKTHKAEFQGLLAHPPGFGLHAGTVMLLGIAGRHPHAQPLLAEFNQRLKTRIEIKEYPSHPAYFGYHTVLKRLTVGHRSLHPLRYAEGDEAVVHYRDAAAIFHGPLNCFCSEDEFGAGAARLIWVASLQRLANGIAVRLLTDMEFRRHCLKGYDLAEYNFEDDGRVGFIVFEVVVAHTIYGDEIRSFEVVKHEVRAATARDPLLAPPLTLTARTAPPSPPKSALP